MPKTQTDAPPTARFPAAVEISATRNPHHGQRCRVHHRDGHIDAWTWLDLAPAGGVRVVSGDATTMEISCDGTDFLLLGFAANDDASLGALLADGLSPIPGVVRQTASLVDGLKIAGLRALVKQALLLPDAFNEFWQRPASRRDHHAYPGGLAEHSLEVATMVASVSGLPEEDRELGIAFALLHDFGKIWCYAPGRRAQFDPREHEGIGRSKLQHALQRLAATDALLAARMDELLGGPRAPRDTGYPLAIGRVIRSFDQMSCEKTRRVSATIDVTDEAWVPF